MSIERVGSLVCCPRLCQLVSTWRVGVSSADLVGMTEWVSSQSCHISHNTMYQKIPIHEKLYNQDAQFSQRIFCCHTTFYHKANTTKSPVPNFAGMSCYCWWGGSKRACQTSSGKGTPCAPAEKSENVVHCKSVDILIIG